MIVRMKRDIVDGGVTYAKAGDTGIVVRLVGGTKMHVKFDNPLAAPEAVLSAENVEAVEGGVKNFVSRRISVDDIDLANYELFKQECDEIKSYVTPFEAMQLSAQASQIGAYISKYKALLYYTSTTLDKEVKHAYAVAMSAAQGSSQDKREAVARQDPSYQAKLDDLAAIRAAQIYIDDAYEFTKNMHFLYKEVYSGEIRTQQSTDPADR